MRTPLFIFGLLCASPAAAQLGPALSPAYSSWIGAEESAEPVKPGLVVQPLSSGFKPARPGVSLHGFRISPEEGAFVGYRHGNWLLGSTLKQVDEIASDPSTSLDFGAIYGLNLSPRQQLSVEGGIRFDLTSGLGLRAPNTLAPGAGENGLGLRMAWRYSFDRNRFVSTSVGYEQSLGDRSDGDGQERTGATFGTYFGYRY